MIPQTPHVAKVLVAKELLKYHQFIEKHNVKRWCNEIDQEKKEYD